VIELSGGESKKGLGFLPKEKDSLVRNSARGLRRGEDFLELQS